MCAGGAEGSELGGSEDGWDEDETVAVEGGEVRFFGHVLGSPVDDSLS